MGWEMYKTPSLPQEITHPVKLIDATTTISLATAGLVLLSTPGHTPGHQSLLVRTLETNR